MGAVPWKNSGILSSFGQKIMAPEDEIEISASGEVPGAPDPFIDIGEKLHEKSPENQWAFRRQTSRIEPPGFFLCYKGILLCFFGGLVSFLFWSMRKPAISFARVTRGSMISSMKPRCAAT